MRDGINYLLDFQWDVAQRQDVTVSLIEPGSASSLHGRAASARRDERGAVPQRAGAAALRPPLAPPGVTGLPRDATLNRLLDAMASQSSFPPDGLLVSAKLAEILGAKPGDRIALEVQEGRRPTSGKRSSRD